MNFAIGAVDMSYFVLRKMWARRPSPGEQIQSSSIKFHTASGAVAVSYFVPRKKGNSGHCPGCILKLIGKQQRAVGQTYFVAWSGRWWGQGLIPGSNPGIDMPHCLPVFCRLFSDFLSLFRSTIPIPASPWLVPNQQREPSSNEVSATFSGPTVAQDRKQV